MRFPGRYHGWRVFKDSMIRSLLLCSHESRYAKGVLKILGSVDRIMKKVGVVVVECNARSPVSNVLNLCNLFLV